MGLSGVTPDSRGTAVLKNITLLSGAALAATVSGLVREATLAGVFGTTAYADATATAIFLHDMIAAAFITGGFSFTVVPFVARERAAGGDAVAVPLVTATVVWVACLGALAAVATLLALPPIVRFAVHSEDRVRNAAMLVVLRGAVPALALMTIASAIAGFLPAFGRFHQPSVGRLLWNATISAGLLAIPRIGADSGIALALALGATANLLAVALALPGRNHQRLVLHHPGLRSFAALAASSLVGIAAINAGLGIWERFLLARIGVGSIAVVNYAQRASYTASTVSTAVAVVAFTEMAHHAETGRLKPAGGRLLREVTRRYLLVLVPVMCFMWAARRDIVNLLFARGAFDVMAQERTSAAFGVYAASVLPVFLLSLFTRALYTLNRSRLAIAVLACGALISAVLDGLLVPMLGELSIPAGYATGTAAAAALAVWATDRQTEPGVAVSVWSGLGLGAALAAPGLVLYEAVHHILRGDLRCGPMLPCLGALAMGVVSFAAAAVIVGYALGMEEVRMVVRWIRDRSHAQSDG
ncbi:MAG TPA: lipid II flippase MurJ [Gemmatimonadales bacterium]|nr:lipid II flippase MurJ [Gemmatimonadales bacterium]